MHQHDDPRCDFTAECILQRHGMGGTRFDNPLYLRVIADVALAVENTKKNAEVVADLGFGEAKMEKVQMNPGIGYPNILEPAGPMDPEVSFLSVQSLEGRPIAVFTNYSLHYVGGVPRGDIPAIYFALFSDRLQELIKADHLDRHFVDSQN